VKQRICISGSGKMARNTGVFYLKSGHELVFLAGNRENRSRIEKEIKISARRLQKAGYVFPEAEFAVIGDKNIKCDVVIECTFEDRLKKQRVVKAVFDNLDNPSKTILLSASSSCLPSEIHRECIGCHFFYPVELTGVVEMIQNPSTGKEKYDTAMRFIRGSGFEVIEQQEKNAFAVNRLLLPVQAEAVQMLRLGYNSETVNEATVNEYLPIGQLSVMDSVGLSTILASVRNYVGRMPLEMQKRYDILCESLSLMIKSGVKDKGNHWLIASSKDNVSEKMPGKQSLVELREKMRILFINSCCNSVETMEISKEDLNMAMQSIFGGTKSMNLLI
jgi:3-hydroxyacyl-CoA dehydrogenase